MVSELSPSRTVQVDDVRTKAGAQGPDERTVLIVANCVTAVVLGEIGGGQVVALVGAACLLLTMTAVGLYRPRLTLSALDDVPRIALAVGLAWMVVAWIEPVAPSGVLPPAIALLFQHGEYTAADTAATSAILRIYLIGLLGHAFVGVLSRPFFSGERPTWFPAAAMVGGLVLNAILAVLLAGPFGARGIAASNAAGILLAALLLLVGARRAVPGLVTGAVLTEAGRLAVPAVAAAGAGLLVSRLLPGDLAPAVLGALVVPAAFAAVAALTVPAGLRAVVALIPGRSTS